LVCGVAVVTDTGAGGIFINHEQIEGGDAMWKGRKADMREESDLFLRTRKSLTGAG
jgi:hypothetical protein